MFDVDGSIMPQGGPIHPAIAAFFRALSKLGLIMGPATGKNCDYGRGLACGIGVVWDFVAGESGARFIECVGKSGPPIYKQRVSQGASSDLSSFIKKIDYDLFGRGFSLRGQIEKFRPELKEGILTLFPPGRDLDVTLDWLSHFEDIIDTFGFQLKLQRFSDGCIDIVPEGISKQLGVQEVCRTYKCSPDQILVVVDGSNDIELTQGTLVIAVANAIPELKKIATAFEGYVSEKVDGAGFVEGILHFAESNKFDASINNKIKALCLATLKKLV